ncbi:hypothetical protein TNCV_1790011 [Trichonephila clavipes]|nr:hypothetical protein TNCV_1790011 [Trichonephila clavipes]
MQGLHYPRVRRNVAFMGDVHLPAENNEGVSIDFYGEGFMRNAQRERERASSVQRVSFTEIISNQELE